MFACWQTCGNFNTFSNKSQEKRAKFFSGNWGFGQDGQERKCAFELNIVVDVIGQYVLNAREMGKREGERERESSRTVAGTTCTKNACF